jgi:hypothetical protein
MKDLSCLQCKQEFNIIVPDLCGDCMYKKFEENLNEEHKKLIEKYKQIDKEHSWKSKNFAYHMLLYLPLCYFICLKFGFWYEMAFIAGGIYLVILPTIRNWLVDKF